MRTRHRLAPLLLVAVAGLVAACVSPAAGTPTSSPTAATEPAATASPPAESPSATAAATPSATSAPTSTPTPVPSSSPETALLIRLDVCADTCVDPRRVEYLADGRVVRLDLETGRLVERTLSPAGLARVRARVAEDATLLGRDLDVFPEPVPGKTPPGHGVISYAFIAPTAAGGRATIRTVTAPSLDAGYWVPDPRIDRLTALGDGLLDPEKLAGSDGWAGAYWTAYEPARTAVFVHVRDGAAPFSSPDLGATGWPFGADPRTFGEPFASTMDAWPIARCALMDTADARAAAAALPAGALGPEDPASLLRMGTMAWAAKGLELDVTLRVPLPDDAGTPCGDLWIGG